MQDDEKSISDRLAKSSERFWDRKARFTYYLLSLPFALTAVAVSSFRANVDTSTLVLIVEVLSWLLFMLAGALGLMAKWGEMEVARMESLMANIKLTVKREVLDKGQSLPMAGYEAGRENYKKLRFAERMESIGSKWIVRILLVACLTWIFGRGYNVLSPIFSIAN